MNNNKGRNYKQQGQQKPQTHSERKDNRQTNKTRTNFEKIVRTSNKSARELKLAIFSVELVF